MNHDQRNPDRQGPGACLVPIRSREELHAALHYQLKVDEPCEESEIGRMESLFSPRDFLFTNAEQLQKIVKARQCVLVGDESDVH